MPRQPKGILSLETRKKMSLVRKGRKKSAEWKQKISKSLMGHPGSRKLHKEKATYSGYHYRIYSARGKAHYCSVCGLNDPQRKYYWANLTGKYHDLSDYMPMCQSCHMKYDAQRWRENGSKNTSRLR